MRIIIFDLYDTLLDKVWFDYDKIIDYLIGNCFAGVEKESLLLLAKEYQNLYMLNRNETNVEVSFIDQLKYYESKLGQKLNASYQEIEWNAFTRCRCDKAAEGANGVLSYFKKRGYRLAVLSNGIFSSETVKRYLQDFDIREYFDVIISSADIKVRKPAKEAFKSVLKKLNIETSKEIFFVGNNLQKDIIGAREAGLTPIFINKMGESFDGITVESLKGVQTLFEEQYIYLNSIMPLESLVDGPGLRMVVFLQGCIRHCPDCHNQNTWDLTKGLRIRVDELAEMLKEKSKNKKITITGGEPLLQAQALLKLCVNLSDFDICLYTSYEIENVPLEIKEKIHYLKVGKFERNKRTTKIPYVGSANQRIIDVRITK